MDDKAPYEYDWWREWRWPIFVIVVTVITALIYVSVDAEVTKGAWFKSLIFGNVAVIVFWALYCFTGDPYQQRTQTVMFAYFSVLASFAILGIPPFVKQQAIGGEPIGIVSGCVIEIQPNTGGKELVCSVRNKENTKNPSKSEKAEQAIESQNVAPNASQENRKVAAKELGKTDPKVEKQRPADALQTAPNPENFQWLINIGGTLSRHVLYENVKVDKAKDLPSVGSPEMRAAVTGGVVVPIYFVILALFGGAVSLSRRVPEIQKRSENLYVGTVAEPKLQSWEVREMLAFQMIQFISAPLIAITAYEVIQPNTQATEAALAFMSGFGSETILLMIRGVFNGIKPLSPTPTQTGVVRGVVTDGLQRVGGVTIGVKGTGLKAISDINGNYEIREVPVGERQLVASGTGLYCEARVSISPSVTAMCDVALKRIGAVSGTVTDATSKAVEDATITIAGNPPLQSKTDKNGKFAIENVPVGAQQIDGQQTTASVTIRGSGNVNVVFGQSAICNFTLT